ncbi:hypothetical protein [Haladaptatus sp. ZSTT2]|uniref:hypothetical protein n=1 Tax=Haladaptatus sp. ZSTT2 TaxID=3120515 RepID=UPI00300EE460
MALAVFEDAIRSVADIVHFWDDDDETESTENRVPAGPHLVAHVVKRVPPDAIVTKSWTDPITDCHPIQYILKEAFLSKQTPKLVLTKQATINEVRHVFSLLPYTEGEDEGERDGYYVNTSQGVVVLTLETPVKPDES